MAMAASEPAWLVRLLAGLIHEQQVLTLARELDEIFSVLSFEGLSLICMGENESPAQAVDVSRGVGLREVACEVFRGLQGGDCSLGKVYAGHSLQLTEHILHGVGISHLRIHGRADCEQCCCLGLAGRA